MVGRILYVERDSQEGNDLVDLINNSGLEVEVLKLDKKEVDEKKRYFGDFPILFTPEGIFRSRRYVEWYARVFGVGGPQYKPDVIDDHSEVPSQN